MIAVIVDHIPWAPSLFFLFSGGGKLFASPAEGFFVISGMLVGYLYGPKILYQTRQIAVKIWKRAGLLYLMSVGFTILFTCWTLLLPEGRIPLDMWTRSVPSYLLNTFTLRYSYGWTDFLSRYALFMAIAPLALWLIAKNKWWVVAISSFLIWLLLGRIDLFMPFAAWQLLFGGGMIIGYYLPHLRKLWNTGISIKQRRTISYVLVYTTVITFSLSVLLLVILPYANSELQNGFIDTIVSTVQSYPHIFDKQTLGIGRLILGTIWFSCLYFFTRTYESKINTFTKGFVEIFGRNSLFIYGLHAFVLFVILTVIYPIHADNVFINTILSALTLVVIYFIAKYRHRIFARLHKVK